MIKDVVCKTQKLDRDKAILLVSMLVVMAAGIAGVIVIAAQKLIQIWL